MQTLTLEGKITVFKALAMSKIVHLALITNIPTSTMKKLNEIQTNLFGNRKINHNALCNNYGNGVLKNFCISSKIISLQCS